MKLQQVCEQPTFRHERGSGAKAAFLAGQTLLRWEIKRANAFEERRRALRAANRRWLRRNGMAFGRA